MIYVLNCQKGKYYLTTVNYETFNADTIEWTKRFKPIGATPINNQKLNDCVIEYMEKYGIDNVRGGDYSNLVLSKFERAVIIGQFATRCVKCGRTNHSVENCHAKKHVDGHELDIKTSNDFDADLAETTIDSQVNSPVINSVSSGELDLNADDYQLISADWCGRCGRSSHQTSNCHAKNHVNGESLCEPAKQTYCIVM